MEEKICNNCGYHNDVNSAFCTGCGTSLEGVIVTKVVQAQPVNNNVNTNTNNVESEKTNGFAIASMILGILSVTLGWFFMQLVLSTLAITFSLVAKQKIKAFNEKGKGMATAGLVLGIIGIAIWVIAFIIGFIIGLTQALA